MKTIVEALKDLYVAMGGESSAVADFSLNPDVIQQIASLVASGETKELPAVTAADNDKVLAVVNGAWDKAEASGGGGEAVILKLNSSFNGLLFEDDTPVNPSNFPYDKVPNVYLTGATGDLFRISNVKTGSTTELDFIGFAYKTGTTTVKNFIYYIFKSNNSSTAFSLFTTIMNPALPTIGPNDGGKYLAVNSAGNGLEWVSNASM